MLSSRGSQEHLALLPLSYLGSLEFLPSGKASSQPGQNVWNVVEGDRAGRATRAASGIQVAENRLLRPRASALLALE